MTIFRRLLAIILALSFALPAHGIGQRRPKNPRHGRKPASLARAGLTGPDIGRRWTSEARSAIWKLMAERGSKAASYDAQQPPAAVIDRVAAVEGDAAEAVFLRLVSEAEFKFGDDFWDLIPAGWGRQRLRAAHEQFSVLPKSVWNDQPTYRQYRKGFLEAYLRIRDGIGLKEGRAFIARLLMGFTDEEAREYAKKAIEEEAKQAPREELVGESDVDPQPVRWRRGFQIAPEIKALVGALRAEGFDVWSVGLSAQPVLIAESQLWGVDPTRCLGIAQGAERERLNGQLREPIPIRVGAVEAAVSSLGRKPVLVTAGSAAVADLALYSEGVRVIVDRGDEELRRRLSGAAVLQPSFSPPRPRR